MLATSTEVILPRRAPAFHLRPQAAQHGVSFALREFTRRTRKSPTNRRTAPRQGRYYDLLTDFRHGGFRLLGDLVCDMDDLATARERKQLRRPADSPAFQKMMEAYLSAPFSGNERAVVSKVCRKLLNKIIRPSLAVPYVVALGKRNLLWDLLPDHIEEHVLEVHHAE